MRKIRQEPKYGILSGFGSGRIWKFRIRRTGGVSNTPLIVLRRLTLAVSTAHNIMLDSNGQSLRLSTELSWFCCVVDRPLMCFCLCMQYVLLLGSTVNLFLPLAILQPLLWMCYVQCTYVLALYITSITRCYQYQPSCVLRIPGVRSRLPEGQQASRENIFRCLSKTSFIAHVLHYKPRHITGANVWCGSFLVLCHTTTSSWQLLAVVRFQCQQGRRSHRIIGGDIKEEWGSGRRKSLSGVHWWNSGIGVWGTKSPSGVQVRSPGRGCPPS